MSFKDLVLMTVGSLVALCGTVIIVGASLGPDDSTGPVGHVMLTVFFGVLPMIGGAYLVWLPFRGRRRRNRESLERRVLELAGASGGSLTPAELAMKTDLTLDESKTLLDGMVLSGHAVSDIREDGQIAFRFPVVA